RPAQVDRFLVAFVAWSVAATGWGFLQFVGAVNEFEGKRPGQREVSFLGIHDFAGFSGATLAIGLAAIALAKRRRLAIVAVAAGGARLHRPAHLGRPPARRRRLRALVRPLPALPRSGEAQVPRPAGAGVPDAGPSLGRAEFLGAAARGHRRRRSPARTRDVR